jgi:hypothetical protein
VLMLTIRDVCDFIMHVRAVRKSARRHQRHPILPVQIRVDHRLACCCASTYVVDVCSCACDCRQRFSTRSARSCTIAFSTASARRTTSAPSIRPASSRRFETRSRPWPLRRAATGESVVEYESIADVCVCRFFKIASIRELLPRIFMEICLLPCYRFVQVVCGDRPVWSVLNVEHHPVTGAVIRAHSAAAGQQRARRRRSVGGDVSDST